MQVSWDNFRAFNHDSRGIEYKFEDLCRQLFVNENLGGNKQFKYLHSNPNNYGLELSTSATSCRKLTLINGSYYTAKVQYFQRFSLF